MQLGVDISKRQLTDAKNQLHAAAMRMPDLDPNDSWQGNNGGAARTTINSGFASGLRKPKDLSHVGRKNVRKDEQGEDSGDKEKQSLGNAIITLAKDECELFCDSSGNPFASFEHNGHREVWSIHSTGFRKWIGARMYIDRRTAIPEATMTNAVATIAAIAKYEGERREVYRRRAFFGGSCWIDLGDDDWNVARVSGKGWRIVDKSPVMFTRTATMRPLPIPDPEAEIEDIEMLWSTANIDEQDRPLALAWMLESLRCDTPDVGLGLIGEQGTAKSETQKQLRSLIDPSDVPLRGAPKSVDDIYIAAFNSMMVSYENMSGLDGGKQDALCSILTGGGFATRTLYTNGEETVLKTQAPVILNGIADVVTAPDLLDRFVIIRPPRITDRRTPTDVRDEFEKAKPKLFGALLTLFATTLRKLSKVQIPASDLPRMADFALLGEAMSRVLGMPKGDFLQRYADKRKANAAMALDASPAGAAILAYLGKHPEGVNGLVSRVFERLRTFMPDDPGAPRTARGFGSALRRVAPVLAQNGIVVSFSEVRGEAGITCSIGYEHRLKKHRLH